MPRMHAQRRCRNYWRPCKDTIAALFHARWSPPFYLAAAASLVAQSPALYIDIAADYRCFRPAHAICRIIAIDAHTIFPCFSHGNLSLFSIISTLTRADPCALPAMASRDLPPPPSPVSTMRVTMHVGSRPRPLPRRTQQLQILRGGATGQRYFATLRHFHCCRHCHLRAHRRFRAAAPPESGATLLDFAASPLSPIADAPLHDRRFRCFFDDTPRCRRCRSFRHAIRRSGFAPDMICRRRRCSRFLRARLHAVFLSLRHKMLIFADILILRYQRAFTSPRYYFCAHDTVYVGVFLAIGFHSGGIISAMSAICRSYHHFSIAFCGTLFIFIGIAIMHFLRAPAISYRHGNIKSAFLGDDSYLPVLHFSFACFPALKILLLGQALHILCDISSFAEKMIFRACR